MIRLGILVMLVACGAAQTQTSTIPRSPCAPTEDGTNIALGHTCPLPIRVADVASVAECRSPHFDVRVDNRDDTFVVTAVSVGCGDWVYVDREHEIHTHRICVVR